jgi:tetratricopeptide (TPR) repeat protein
MSEKEPRVERAPVQGDSKELTPHQAIQFYERAVDENPNDADKYMELGAAYYIAHRWKEAIGAFEKAAALQPNLGHAHYYLGVLYAATGDKERAQKELDTVLQVSDNAILKAQAKSRIPFVNSTAQLAANP